MRANTPQGSCLWGRLCRVCSRQRRLCSSGWGGGGRLCFSWCSEESGIQGSQLCPFNTPVPRLTDNLWTVSFLGPDTDIGVVFPDTCAALISSLGLNFSRLPVAMERKRMGGGVPILPGKHPLPAFLAVDSWLAGPAIFFSF